MKKLVVHILEDTPANRNLRDNKWVFKSKEYESGKVDTLKYRGVMKSYMKTNSIDYALNFAPVSRISKLRVILSVVIRKKLHVNQMDVNKALLHACLDAEGIFINPPLG